MKNKVFNGTICLDNHGLTYYICDISYIIYEDESFEYIFKPNYFVIDLLDNSVFQGIPGLNLDDRKEVYVRKNLTPIFISERVPQKNREDLYDLLNEVGLDYLNPIQYLLRTNKRYGGDPLYLKEKISKTIFNADKLAGKHNSFGLIKIILNNLALGNDVIYQSILIDDTNRKEFHNVLLGIYLKSLSSRKENQQNGVEQAKLNHKYKGRKPVTVDQIFFESLLEDVENNKMSVVEASKALGISKYKFYRLMNEKKQYK